MTIAKRHAARAGMLFAAVLFAGWVGCTSSSGEVAPQPAEAGADAALPPDPPTEDAAAEASPTDNVGSVFAISDTTAVDGRTVSTYRAGASFRHVTTPGTLSTEKTVGPCLLETFGAGKGPLEEPLSAGAVHIEGGRKSVDLVTSADNTYAVVSGKDSLWNGGETLTVRAEGKDVPAFTASVIAPSKVTLTAPAATAGELTVTRSAGVSATFTGTSAGVVVLYFDAAAGANAYSATCTFPASAGSGQIPAAAFADFPAAEGTFDFYVKSDTSAAPARWDVRVTLTSAVVDVAGSALAGRATFK